ncbi:Surfeit locus protein 2 [Lamellibrachia satsuma]|nr:Surfeit locus protein 2 [Lamellibrachia satsuma]
MSKTPNEEITDILVDNPALTLIQNGEKVKCTLSGHEMPAKKDALQSYISGKKYQRLHKMKECDLEKYKRHLVPSSKKWRKNQLFCLLTLRHLNNSPVHIQRHTDGKRFQKALHRWELCQETGVEFKARQGWKRPQVDSDPSDEEDEGREEDNLDDLYPPADFLSSDQHARDVSGSEGELDENMEPERCSPAKKTPGSGPKNKVPGGSSKATKRKKSDSGKVKQPSGKRAK